MVEEGEIEERGVTAEGGRGWREVEERGVTVEDGIEWREVEEG